MKKLMLLLLWVIPSGVFSQEKIWTLEECVEYAVLHNPQHTKQAAQNEIYRYNQRDAIGGFLPSLNAGTGVSVNFGRGVDPETNTYISTNTFSNAYEIYSSLTLFDGFAQIYRAKTANINRLKGKEELRALKDKTTFEVMEIFFNVLYYKGTVTLAGQQLEESVQTLKKFRRMEELGLKSIPDLAEMQAKEAEDRFLLTRQTNLYNLEVIKLKEKMNLPVEENLSVKDYEQSPLVSAETHNATDIYRQALAVLPAVQASVRSVSATRMEYKTARGRLFPSLSLNAGFSTGFSRLMDGTSYMSFNEQLKLREGSYVSATLSIPLFNGFSRFSEVKRSRLRLIIAQNQHEETLRRVYSEIEQTVADVNGLSDEYLHAQKRTAAMQSAHRMNLRKYEAGLTDAVTLTASSNRLLNSRIEELYTNLKYQLKYKLLNYYKGSLEL
ncbi:MAG: TolC family protein [Dysgonamonadaceae bacterium]|jgi:outer membrane protein TolC|nr:TolC family protein [Dysgonamonadaceae bacterium]